MVQNAPKSAPEAHSRAIWWPRSGPSQRKHLNIKCQPSQSAPFRLLRTPFFNRPEVVDFGVWAAPGRSGNPPKRWGVSPPFSGRFPDRPGPPQPQKSAISGRSKNHRLQTQLRRAMQRWDDPRIRGPGRRSVRARAPSIFICLHMGVALTGGARLRGKILDLGLSGPGRPGNFSKR